jgi:hypothetical protein
VIHHVYADLRRHHPAFSVLGTFGSALALVATCIAIVGGGPALAASARLTITHKPPTHRVGGKVHHAWPRAGRPPRTPLARWLARQVGPTRAQPCRTHVRGKLVKCRRKRPPRTGAPLSGGQLGATKARDASAVRALLRLGQIITPLAHADSASSTTTATTSTGSTNLLLVRSYAIPSDDPSYTRLLNWSWTYDSAITAAAFSVFGATGEAQQLLDQLSALQHTNGSIEVAFNVADGTAESQFRSGTIASVGLAGSLYDQRTHTSRYLAMEQRTASYLLSLQGSNGLVRGGPDVAWASTQHNLLAYAFLNLLGNELVADGQRSTANQYFTAANKISAAIDSKLLVHGSGTTSWFIEGLGDTVQSLDADALGVPYLVSHGQTGLAQQVLAYTQGAFAVTGRSISRSTAAATYNNTYAAAGPFAGFKPFVGSGAPDVLWTEGSAEMLLADAALGQSTSALNASMLSIAALTPASGPLMADRTVTNQTYDAEFHVWPSAAAGAWMILGQVNPTLFPGQS